jgi:hypothetical protein
MLGAQVAISWFMCLVSQWALTMSACVHSQTNQFGICDKQISIGTGFAQSPYLFPVGIIPLMFHIHLLYCDWDYKINN